MVMQPIPPPGPPGPQNQATQLLAVLARFAARARLAGATVAGVPALGQMAAFRVGSLWVPFWINPMTYRETSSAIKADLNTPGLVRRTYFGAHPQVINLEGTTGTAGYDARTGGMADLSRMKPFVATPNARIEFYYPYMFAGARYCYVNRFVQQTTPDAPLLFYYQIEMTAYPKQDKLACGVTPGTVSTAEGERPPSDDGERVVPKPKKLPVTPATRSLIAARPAAMTPTGPPKTGADSTYIVWPTHIAPEAV